MKKFYHYTSIKALYSIISNHELWFPNLKNSNDPNEMYLTCDEYNKYVENMGINPYHGTPIILNNNNILGSPYGMSFTTLKDNLSQWERYGDNLAGVSIEFDVDFIQKYLRENYHFTFDFGCMKYTETQKKELIKRNISKIIDVENYSWKDHWPRFALYFIIHYSEARALFKSNDFSAEKEHRLFFDPVEYKFYHDILCLFQNEYIEESNQDYGYAKDIIHFLEQDKKYTLMRNGINSYLSLDLNLFGKDNCKLIKEIILGPKCTQDTSELSNFLSLYGYSPCISKSKINIR